HAVEPAGLLGALRSLPRWSDLARVVRRHPGVRRRLALGVFWKPSHAALAVAVAGVATRRRILAAGGALAWAALARPRYGGSPRGAARAISELPGRAVVDAAEMAVLARGSLRERTLLL